MFAIEEHRVLRRLQPGQRSPNQAERPAVEPWDLDHECAAGPQDTVCSPQAAERVVIVLEEVPHRDQVERPVRESAS